MVETREQHADEISDAGVHRDEKAGVCKDAGRSPSRTDAWRAPSCWNRYYGSVHVSGFSLHDELKLFVEAGLTPMLALETATTNPSLFLGLSKTWGRVEPGYTANMVLLNADPLADISNIDNIDSVVVSGQRLDRAQLDQLLNDAKHLTSVPTPAP